MIKNNYKNTILTSMIALTLLTSVIAVGGIQNAYAVPIGPNIEFTKTCTVIEPIAPGEITWNFEITNSGSSIAVNIVLDDQQLEEILGFPGFFPAPLSPIEAGGSIVFPNFALGDLPAGEYLNSATVTFEDEAGNVMTVFDNAACTILPNLEEVEVEIDIKPGSDPNSIKVDKRGKIPVAVLGSATLDVSDIDVTTLMFAGASPAHDLTDALTLAEHTQDVNGDGFDDLVSHYVTNDTTIACGDTSATISGSLLDGTTFEGSDSVRTVPCK